MQTGEPGQMGGAHLHTLVTDEERARVQELQRRLFVIFEGNVHRAGLWMARVHRGLEGSPWRVAAESDEGLTLAIAAAERLRGNLPVDDEQPWVGKRGRRPRR